MDDIKAKLKIRGVNQAMRASGVQNFLNEKAYRMRAAAGPGHKVTVYPHRWGARAFVEQEDASQARKDPNAIQLLQALSEVTD